MWIRSQDKEVLGKFDMLYIDENMSDEIVITGCDGHVHVNDKVLSACELGTYKSKERAIEVLDEIQTCISNFFEYEVMPPQNNDWFFSVQAVPRTNKIYNMPEE